MWQVKTRKSTRLSANLSQDMISWKSYYDVLVTEKDPSQTTESHKTTFAIPGGKKGQIFVLPKNISLSKTAVSLEKQLYALYIRIAFI